MSLPLLLTALLAVEAAPAAGHFKTPRGLEGDAGGKVSAVRSEGSEERFSVSVDGGARVECRLRPEPVAVADEVAAALGRLDAAGLGARLGVEVFGERPALLALGSGATAGDGSKAPSVGAFRFGRCEGPDAEAVRAVTAAVARTLTGIKERDPGKVRFLSVQLLKRDGVPVGFNEYRILQLPEGGEALLALGSMVLHGGGKEPRATEMDHLEVVDPRGMLLRGRYTASYAPAPKYDLSLKAIGDGRYEFSGTVDGEPKGGTFSTRAGLATALVRAAAFSKAGGYGPPVKELLTLEIYVPRARIDGSSTIVHERDPERPRGIKSTTGRSQTFGVVDDDGMIEWLQAKGPGGTRYETVLRKGSGAWPPAGARSAPAPGVE
jgi:hypothetical protein